MSILGKANNDGKYSNLSDENFLPIDHFLASWHRSIHFCFSMIERRDFQPFGMFGEKGLTEGVKMMLIVVIIDGCWSIIG